MAGPQSAMKAISLLASRFSVIGYLRRWIGFNRFYQVLYSSVSLGLKPYFS
jgi:hypothetical protein